MACRVVCAVTLVSGVPPPGTMIFCFTACKKRLEDQSSYKLIRVDTPEGGNERWSLGDKSIQNRALDWDNETAKRHPAMLTVEVEDRRATRS